MFGAFVRGIDLKEDIKDSVIQEIKALVRRYRLLIFKDQAIAVCLCLLVNRVPQGIVPAERQVIASAPRAT